MHKAQSFWKEKSWVGGRGLGGGCRSKLELDCFKFDINSNEFSNGQRLYPKRIVCGIKGYFKYIFT